MGFGEVTVEFWVRAASVSEQSSRKQKERSCTSLQHGPCSEACASFSEHGCGARAVKQRRAHQFGAARVSLHGPCSSSSAHGSSTRGVSVRHANPFFRTRGVLRLSTDRAERFCTGLGWLCTGRVSPVLTGREN